MDWDTDLMLTVGIVLLILSLPSLLSAWVEGRAPRLGALMIAAGAVLVGTALSVRPGGYAFDDVPGVVIDVVARLWR
jgi:formate-dependent nitrite reductase membrane component NrfD